MSTPFVFGLDYTTSGFEMRDKLAFSIDEIPSVLKRLQSSGITKELVILSTCNRTEIYCITPDIDFLINAVCDIQNICPRTVKKYSYIYSGTDCVNHLFRVVSGLESMVLGETEIVAQVKGALNLSKQHNSFGVSLSAIFQMALAVEKDVRSTTEINNIAISIGSALVSLVAVNFADISKQSILFIGAGKMMSQIAPHFKSMCVAKKTVINRTTARGQVLAKRIDADFVSYSQLSTIINDYSIIIVCLSNPIPILDDEVLCNTVQNTSKKVLIIDLSMPLLTSLNLRKYANVTLLTIDDIAKIVDVGVEKRKQASFMANELIDNKIVEYQGWLQKRGLTPVIRALRDNAEGIRLDVLTEAQKKLQNGELAQDILCRMSIKLTNRLLHNPTINLCASEDKKQEELTELVTYLYDLEIST